jgi:hypothetical protein
MLPGQRARETYHNLHHLMLGHQCRQRIEVGLAAPVTL